MYADLHLHTYYSDGTFSPSELAQRADALSLSTLALTDHDTLEGVAPMAEACTRRGIELIAGTELTAALDNEEVHLLGYFEDPSDSALRDHIARFQKFREVRVHDMVSKLNDCQIALTVEAVLKVAACRSPGRPHVARALVREGFCQTPDEAFERYLKKNRPAWVPKARIEAADAITLIREAGGVAVLAHPGLHRNDGFIPRLVEAGLDGLECFHSRHTAGRTQRYLRLASELGLLVTGGSDCHGYSKALPLIGSVTLDNRYMEPLRAHLAARAKERPAAPEPLEASS